MRLYDNAGGRCSLKLTRDGKAYIAVNSGRNAFESGKRIEEVEQQIAGEVRYVTDILDLLLGTFVC